MGEEPDRLAERLIKGASVGRYIVIGRIGRGGMGEVFAAYDPELNRRVAVKVFQASRADDPDSVTRRRRRLQREAQAIAQLSHPNVVVIYDVGAIERSLFLAMEFIEGRTLGDWQTNEPRRSWREVLEVYLAAGRGLAAAHQALLVHRDFKPDNVMITNSGQVRVMDFGLVSGATEKGGGTTGAHGEHADRDADTRDAQLTDTGAFLGTPAYMAPEQFSGEQCDARSDQFSFAVALWEALYGERPFAGDTVAQLMVNVTAGVRRDPTPASPVPGWVRRVLLRALSVERERRYPSMGELLDELSRGPAIRRRRRFAVAVALLSLAVVATGVRREASDRRRLCAAGPERSATAWGPDFRRKMARAFKESGSAGADVAFTSTAALLDDYVRRWTRQYTEVCEATHVRGDQSAEILDLRMTCLSERLHRVRALGEVLVTADKQVVDNAVGAASGLPMLERCSDVPLLRAVVSPPEDPGVRARVESVRRDVARVRALVGSGKCEQATAIGRVAVAAATQLSYQPLIAEAHLALGRLGEFCLEPERAAEHMEEASHAGEISHHDEVVVEAAIFAALYHAEALNDPVTARRFLRHGEAVLGRLPGHPILEGWVGTARAVVLLRSGKPGLAVEEGKRALSLLERERGTEHLDIAITLQNLGGSYFEDQRFSEAEAVTDRALALIRRLLGDHNMRTAALLLNRGEILTALERFDEARASIDAGLAIARDQAASGYVLGWGLLLRGRIQLMAGESARARVTLAEAAKIAGMTYPWLTGEVEFALARAGGTSLAERNQSLRRARRARQVLAPLVGAEQKIREIDVWLASADVNDR